jgi:hypothetical protein
MQEFAPALFSTKVHNGSRTIFFDVKNTKQSKPYLLIKESTVSKEGEKKKTYLAVFENELSDFKQALEEVLGFVSKTTK